MIFYDLFFCRVIRLQWQGASYCGPPWVRSRTPQTTTNCWGQESPKAPPYRNRGQGSVTWEEVIWPPKTERDSVVPILKDIISLFKFPPVKILIVHQICCNICSHFICTSFIFAQYLIPCDVYYGFYMFFNININ